MTISTEVNSSKDSDSSLGESTLSNEEKRIKKFVRSMLKGCLFVGSFIEKRYVPQLNSYRHIVKISDAESDVIKFLKAATKRIHKFYLTKKWVGFTDNKCIGTPVGFNIWTNLDEEKIGTYWFKIQHVRFDTDEVEFKLQIVRPYVSESQITHDTTNSSLDTSSSISLDFNSFQELLKKNLKYFIAEIMNFENIKNTATFIMLLTASIITCGAHIIQYLLDFSLKLLREVQGLIRALTPLILSLINLVTKTIGGLYLLIAVLWRDRHGPPKTTQVLFHSNEGAGFIQQTNRALPAISSNEQYSYNYDRSRYGGGVRITPLD